MRNKHGVAFRIVAYFFLLIFIKKLITVGFYMYIEASSPRHENDTAVIKLPPINIAGPLCLTFYYHMYGNHMGSLAVSGRWSGTVREIWNKTGIISL